MYNSIRIANDYLIAGNTKAPVFRLKSWHTQLIHRCGHAWLRMPPLPWQCCFTLNHDDSEVRASLSHNASLPILFLMQLAQDDDLDVRYVMAENTLLPHSILQALARDEILRCDCATKTLSHLDTRSFEKAVA